MYLDRQARNTRRCWMRSPICWERNKHCGRATVHNIFFWLGMHRGASRIFLGGERYTAPLNSTEQLGGSNRPLKERHCCSAQRSLRLGIIHLQGSWCIGSQKRYSTTMLHNSYAVVASGRISIGPVAIQHIDASLGTSRRRRGNQTHRRVDRGDLIQ